MYTQRIDKLCVRCHCVGLCRQEWYNEHLSSRTDSHWWTANRPGSSRRLWAPQKPMNWIRRVRTSTTVFHWQLCEIAYVLHIAASSKKIFFLLFLSEIAFVFTQTKLLKEYLTQKWKCADNIPSGQPRCGWFFVFFSQTLIRQQLRLNKFLIINI